MSFIDQSSLFLHILAAIGLVGGGLLQIMTGSRLRAASSTDDIAQWSGFARAAGPVLIGSAVVSLATGGHMAGSVWTSETSSGFSYPFITLGMVALVVLAPIGPMLGGAQLRRLATDAAVEGVELPTLVGRAQSPGLWGPIHSLVGLGVSLVWVMSAKPASWAVTALILLAGFILGWASGILVSRNP